MKEELPSLPSLLNNASSVSTGLEVRTLEDLQRVAKIFIVSGLFAEKSVQTDLARACVKIMAGQEMGLTPFQAMKCLDVVQGQITPRYQLVGAKIKQSGRYDYTVMQATDQRAAIQFFDRGTPVYLSVFTMDDAIKQKLAGKDGYQRMPADMLFARALTKGCNKVCPEVFFMPAYAPEDFGVSSQDLEPPHPAEFDAEYSAELDKEYADAIDNPDA